MKYGVHYAGPRRGRRGEWVGMAMLVLLVLAVLVSMVLGLWRGLCWLLGAAADGVSSFILHPSSLPLAMAPVPPGAALALVLLGAVLLIWWSVRAERKIEARMRAERSKVEEGDCETEERWRRVRKQQRQRVLARAVETAPRSFTVGPLEALSERETEVIERLPRAEVGEKDEGDRLAACFTDEDRLAACFTDEVELEALSEAEGEEEETLRGGDFERDRLAACFTSEDRLAACFTGSGGREDLRRIVAALTVETCAAREHVRKAQKDLSVEDYGEKLDAAAASLHLCIGCLGGLMEALGGEQAGSLGHEGEQAGSLDHDTEGGRES